MRLRQILFNLLSNVCKFTKEGAVTLRARKAANGVNWIEFAVLAEVKKAAGLRQLATGAARDAARFVHPIGAPKQSTGGEEPKSVPLAERLKAYTRRDTISGGAGNVVDLKPK
jgi:hypothetical protein